MMTDVLLKRGSLNTDSQTEKIPCKPWAEIGVMFPQAKEHQRLAPNSPS